MEVIHIRQRLGSPDALVVSDVVLLPQERDALEREKLKNMTDEERAAYFKANPKEAKQQDKKKWKFMQKYWHKGAYFQVCAEAVQGWLVRLLDPGRFGLWGSLGQWA